MFKFSEKTSELLYKAGWSVDRHFSSADKYIKFLEDEDFYVSDAVKGFLFVFGGLLIRHPHAKLKEKIDYFHFDVIKAINSGDTTWVSEEYSSRVGKKLCIIGEAFRRSMVLCMSEDKKIYAGIDEFLFFVGDSPESAIEALCNGDDLKEIPEQNALKSLDKQVIDDVWNLIEWELYTYKNKSYKYIIPFSIPNKSFLNNKNIGEHSSIISQKMRGNYV